MSIRCYHYRYSSPNSTESDPCAGSFEECRQLKDCPIGVKSDEKYHCFAAAHIVGPEIKNGTPEVSVISAGCWPPHKDSYNGCSSDCTGIFQRAKRYFCCCTTDGCNLDLIPSPIILKPEPDPKPEPASSSTSQGFPYIIVIFLAFTVATLLVGTFFKRRPFKFKRRSAPAEINGGASGEDGLQNGMMLQQAVNQNKVGNLNATELNEFRNNDNVAVLMPFRQPHEGNTHQQQQSRSFDNNNNNNNSADQHQRGFPLNLNHNINNINAHKTSHTQRDAMAQQESRLIPINSIELLEVVGSGRFGRVHRAQLRVKKDLAQRVQDTTDRQQTRKGVNTTEDANFIEVIDDSKTTHDTQEEQVIEEEKYDYQLDEVAVKVIPTREQQSWQNELEIYTSTRTRHPNVLDFFGWCINTDTNCHWLCIEYASRGSLHHYLKENIVDWEQFLSIALGIMRGLSHLHDSNVVHRDFKSKNVLLRQDLSPCITDFGVAAIMDTDIGSQQKKFLQVGTPRYMSPEILECSIVFGVKNFMKIDIYAAALVIWELLSRCYPLPVSLDNTFRASSIMTVDTTIQAEVYHGGGQHLQEGQQFRQSTPLKVPWPEVGPAPYKLPFEEHPEIGSDPDIDKMRKIVCKDRFRPSLRPEWKHHPIEPVYRSLKESWEYDEDARVSATCFVERLERLYLDHHRQKAEIVGQTKVKM